MASSLTSTIVPSASTTQTATGRLSRTVRSFDCSTLATIQASSIDSCRALSSLNAAWFSAVASSWNWRTDSAVASSSTSLIASMATWNLARSQSMLAGEVGGRAAQRGAQVAVFVDDLGDVVSLAPADLAVLLALGGHGGGAAAEPFSQPFEQLRDVIDELVVRQLLRLGHVADPIDGVPPDGEDGVGPSIEMVGKRDRFCHGSGPSHNGGVAWASQRHCSGGIVRWECGRIVVSFAGAGSPTDGRRAGSGQYRTSRRPLSSRTRGNPSTRCNISTLL